MPARPTLPSGMQFPRPRAVRPADDDVGTVLGTQWARDETATTDAGWPGLARPLLRDAVLDAGLATRRGPVAESDRRTAVNYLLEVDADAVPLPLEVACDLCALDANHVRAVIRLHLRP